MTRKTYIYCKDHHDPIWRKSFEEHFRDNNGVVVRSYSEREELQFDRWLDMLPGSNGKYEIEQTCTIKKYLERNPERFETLKSLIGSGQIDVLGGGEAVIDYNLVHGESIYRNFFYSFLWLKNTFGFRPAIACAQDTFGISAQLPQILQQFGLPWLPIYDRMFGSDVDGMEIESDAGKPVRSFWRGVDGSMVCIRRDFTDEGIPNIKARMMSHQAHCSECNGEGCRFCEYSGLDRQVEIGTGPAIATMQQFADSSDSTARIFCGTEEGIKPPLFIREIEAAAAEAGIEPCFVNHRDNLTEPWVAKLLQKLAQGRVTEDEIDSRAEGNPIANGCYTSRSVLKRWNRELEHLLMTAEKFAAFASFSGYKYPRDGFERLWNLMALIQFHDSVTGSQNDDSYRELQKINRWVFRGVGNRLYPACAWIAAGIETEFPEGAIPVVVFNPLNWTVRDAATEIIIPEADLRLGEEEGVVGWEIRTADGDPVWLSGWKRVSTKEVPVHRIFCHGLELPPCGYATLTCRAVIRSNRPAVSTATAPVSENVEAAGHQEVRKLHVQGAAESDLLQPLDADSMENDRYRVSWDQTGLTGIYDKTLGRDVSGPGTGHLWARDDIGSHWETLKFFDQRKDLHHVAEMHVQAFTADENGKPVRKLVIQGKLPNPMPWDVPSDWESEIWGSHGRRIREFNSDEVEVAIHSLEWTQELWLYPDSDRIPMRYTINCDSEHIRLFVPFPFGFITTEDRAFYEIPYGILERPSYEPKDGVHCNPDGSWPAVHWAAAENARDGYTCAVLNRGVPSYRFHGGVMEVTLLRSPRVNVFGRTKDKWKTYDPLLKDHGPRVFDLAFLSGAGGVFENRIVHHGYEFNSPYPAVSLCGEEIALIRERVRSQDAPALPLQHTFLGNTADNVVISAVKRAEDESGLVARMVEVYGKPAADQLHGTESPLREISPMEDETLRTSEELSFRPFEIKTVQYDSAYGARKT